MKSARMFFITVCFVFVSYTAFAANYCLNCFDQVDEAEKYCVVCKAKLSVYELKTKEEQLIHAVTISRKNYRRVLDELRQYYQDTGNQLRLQKTRRELDALDKVPQPLYTNEGIGHVRSGATLQDIEDANILFKDAMMYKKSFSKKNRITAVKRFEKLIDMYPDSDKVGNAAFEVAEIYAGGYLHDYESAAKYYIKSYQLNPSIKQPVLLRAAEMYDRMLADQERAMELYRQAALYSPDAKSRKKAQDRLSVLEQRTAGKK